MGMDNGLLLLMVELQDTISPIDVQINNGCPFIRMMKFISSDSHTLQHDLNFSSTAPFFIL
jgi:hypothetical protein